MLGDAYLHRAARSPLRVELRRRQPPGTPGRCCSPQRGSAAPRAGPRLPPRRVQEAARQLHLVGETERTPGAQPLRGRLPRARQHRCLRPKRRAPTGGRLEQADGTAWMALFSQNMLEIALELAARQELRGSRAQVRAALLPDRGLDGRRSARPRTNSGTRGRFFYDVLRLPTARDELKVAPSSDSPLCAVPVISADVLERFPTLAGRVRPGRASPPDLLSRRAPIPGARSERPAPALRAVVSRMHRR